jgi:hypothetical protein
LFVIYCSNTLEGEDSAKGFIILLMKVTFMRSLHFTGKAIIPGNTGRNKA